MNDDEIYQKLKSGEAPRYIKGIEGFDDSELVQWMASYHEQVKAELLEALEELVHADCHSVRNSTVHINALKKAAHAIERALGQ